MSEREKINWTVGRLRRTRRVQLVLEFLVRGLFWGAIPAALLILASRIWIIPWSEYWLAGGILAAVVLGFVITAFAAGLSSLTVANDIDVTLGLRERISSALALDEGKTARDPFVRTLVRDAAQQVDGLPLKKVYPWHLPRAWKLALPALLIAGAMCFVPQLNLFASDQDRQEMKLVQEQGKKLMQLAEELEKEAEKKQEPLIKEQAEQIKRVGEKLERGNVKKKEALKELQRLKEKLESQAQSQLAEGDRKLLAELGAELSKLDTTRELGKMLMEGDFEELLAELGELAEGLMRGQLSPDQQAMLEDLLKALEEALKSEAADNPAAQAMREALEDIKEAIKQDQQLREQLQKMMEQFQQDVGKLTQQLAQNDMGQQAQQLEQLLQQMQQQMQQNGMVNPQTLDQMRQQLEQSMQAIQNNQNLSPHAQQQLAEQNQKCLDYFKQQESG